MTTTISSSTNLQLESTISKLNTKLARQQQAVKDTEAHIDALRQLIAAQDSQKAKSR